MIKYDIHQGMSLQLHTQRHFLGCGGGVHKSLSDIIKSVYIIDSLTELENDSLAKVEILVVEDALLYDQRSMLCRTALSIRMKESVVICKKGLQRLNSDMV